MQRSYAAWRQWSMIGTNPDDLAQEADFSVPVFIASSWSGHLRSRRVSFFIVERLTRTNAGRPVQSLSGTGSTTRFAQNFERSARE